ncbi:phage tail assembly chaperone [Aestuariibius sp. 2305UL40-4]|uniref:phage tail assembly chaperone n=1 Tax=Aestuariibius violaceus TaxID=3234132 RepID=UPI00345E34F4
MPMYELRDAQGEVANRVICSHEDAAGLAPVGGEAILLNEHNERASQAMLRLRRERDSLLDASDWIEFCPEMPADERISWRCYRQHLRDLPETVADPHVPVWPERYTGRPQDTVTLAIWRKVACAYRWQFEQALDFIPAPDGTAAEGATLGDLLAVLLPAEPQLARALDKITVFERLHTDMSNFAAATSMDDDGMDLLFSLAIAIEAGHIADAAAATTFVADWTGVEVA